ncbi:MAG TPA: LLM class flavin-dependent oxidoreductase [Ignavibacteriaceae bacterium]|jgi:probable LLM family oxidoreductase|nr:MAG: Limonene 1,2-monooxygenase [Ignavibacteria bacterium ADurb.Bin266]OQY74597.1 MAG: luciferase [Ignavibacteriales bacterium UTCHB2]HQF42537.1 LLM class flavin-dependent oxidoreductase [Ignavibacteriaceae bacterium]HQI41404.1 LLM class flavin-dependent oxidoreductase [Ignavibacteriaceae bacterium]
MKLGIGMFGDMSFDLQTKKYQKASERLKEIIEEVKLADELGIDSFAMGEHHREDYAVPAPEILLASVASVTKNIRLLSGVNVISSADPVKLFQDFVMIDLISNHRAEIMAGRGSFIESFPLFGYNLEDYNELFEEKLELLLTLRSNEVVNWKGQFRVPIVNQTIYPRPEREIPISIAVGGTPASVLRAAKLGLPIVFAIIGGNPEQFKPLIEYYKEVYAQSGHDIKKMKIGVHSHTFIADSEEEIMNDYYPHYAHAMNKIGRERGWRSAYTPANFKASIGPDGALYMGEPDYVAEKLIKTIEMFEIEQYIAHIDVGGPDHKQMMKNIELLGTKVFPKVKEYFKG